MNQQRSNDFHLCVNVSMGQKVIFLMSQWSSQMLKNMLSLLRYAQHKYTYEYMFVILILS